MSRIYLTKAELVQENEELKKEQARLIETISVLRTREHSVEAKHLLAIQLLKATLGVT